VSLKTGAQPKLYRKVRLGLLFAIIYAVVDYALNRFGFSNGWTILWPLNGITIALLLMRGRGDWPAILLGVGLGTGIGECLDHNTVGLEVCLRLVSLSEVVLSAMILPPFATLDQWLRKRWIFMRFAGAMVAGPVVSGLMAAALYHRVQDQPFLTAFNNWATSDALGIAAMMPLALSVGSREMTRLFRGVQLPKTIALLTLAFGVFYVTLSVTNYPLTFLVFPTLLLLDLTLSFAGSAIAVAGLCFFSIYLTEHGMGRFGLWSPNLFIPQNVALQGFLGFHILALFPASIVLRERRCLMEDLNSSNEQLLMLASMDGLTGLANRRSLDEEFAQEWKRANRLQTPLAMIMADVDLFKQFNDLYGHQAGDECLQAVATVLRERCNRPQDHVARFGGEEFALLLPHTSLTGAQHLADEIRMAIRELQISHEGSPWQYVTISLGCAAITPDRETDKTELFRLSDSALYKAKHAGRNCVETMDSEEEPALAISE
jgi:diguanylate cyclase (GGDEF)-like protein